MTMCGQYSSYTGLGRLGDELVAQCALWLESECDCKPWYALYVALEGVNAFIFHRGEWYADMPKLQGQNEAYFAREPIPL